MMETRIGTDRRKWSCDFLVAGDGSCRAFRKQSEGRCRYQAQFHSCELRT
jgi:hypothetical protein